MSPEAFDCVVVASPPNQLPIRISQKNGAWSRLPGLALMTVLAALIVGPQIGLALYALAEPGVRGAVAQTPVIALELAFALIFWIALICWPLRLCISRMARRRDVEITANKVRVEDSHPLGQDRWSAPLSSYLGVAHHLRSSHSGVRHEIVLVHPDRGRSIVLTVAEQISDAHVEAAAKLLRLPRVPAENLYGSGRAAPAARPQEAVPAGLESAAA
ncbi:MAG: hypothetical protein ACKVP4_05080 [Hyphomicrobium sp.]